MPLKESRTIWHDGELVPWEQATVHVLSHALHYGSSVFEGIRVYKTPAGPMGLRLTDHIKRMFFSEDGGVAAEILFEATLKTGKEVAFEAVDLFTIKDGKIHKIQMNYDSAKVMQEVGPPPSQE